MSEQDLLHARAISDIADHFSAMRMAARPADEMRRNAILHAENVYLLETLKSLAERDEMAAAMLAKFMEMRAELRKGEAE